MEFIYSPKKLIKRQRPGQTENIAKKNVSMTKDS